MSKTTITDLARLLAEKEDLDLKTASRRLFEMVELDSGQSEASPIKNFFFDFHRSLYWMKNTRGGWFSVNETGVKRELKRLGYAPRPNNGEHLSAVDQFVNQIQRERDICFAGSLAGWRMGMQEIQGQRILVTDSPRLIEPVSGSWPILEKFLAGLLDDEEVDQRPYLYGWLKVAIEALRSDTRRPGQCLVLAGPHDCGKSLLQNLITEILGGRSSKPYQFMTGLTPFNADLFAGEHLMIEDDAASADLRARRSFGAHVKNITVNEAQRCHGKNRPAIMLSPFWRLTISVNDEPENLMVLPPLDDSLADKFIMLRANRSEMPMPTFSRENRAAFWSKLSGDLPAFIGWLLAWEIPACLRSERFGVMHYQHPAILAAIDDLAPENRLLNLIDAEMFGTPPVFTWGGTAEELERQLRTGSSAAEIGRIFSFPTACGVYLARLAKKRPERVLKQRSSECRKWTIKPPSTQGSDGV